MSLVKRSIFRHRFMEQPLFLPFAKIYLNKIVIFHQSDKGKQHRDSLGKNLAEDRKKSYQGFLSKSAKKFIEQKLTAWLYLINEYNKLPDVVRNFDERKLTFLTLTLSSKQIHTDKEIKEKLLEQFLKRLKYEFDIENYFWKAEKQKNGNIHFHLILDKFLPKNSVRRVWNEVQNFHGYLKDYFKKTGKLDPPSTYIEVVDSKKSPINYILKYVAKNDVKNLIDGRCYSFSSKLIHLVVPQVLIDDSVNKFIDYIRKNNEVKEYHEDYFSVIIWSKDVNVLNFRFDVSNYLRKYFFSYACLLYLDNAPDEVFELLTLFFSDKFTFSQKIKEVNFKLNYEDFKHYFPSS